MSKCEHHVVHHSVYHKHVHETLKLLQNKKIIYLSLSKSYPQFVEFLKEAKLESANFLFIDCVTKKTDPGGEICNCVFVGSPRSLTNIGLAVTKCLRTSDKETIFVLDSLSTMLFYHDKNKIGRFSNFLLNQLRSKGIRAVFLSISSDENNDLTEAINSLVDEVVNKK